MKALKSPTTIIAALALFVALGGGAALASGMISGKSIKNHSIPLKKLSRSAIHKLHGQRGRAGAAGADGAGDRFPGTWQLSGLARVGAQVTPSSYGLVWQVSVVGGNVLSAGA